MRILLLTPFVPSPDAPHGGGIALATLAAAMAEQARLGLVALHRPGESTATGRPWDYVRLVPHQDLPERRSSVFHRVRMLWRWLRLPLVAAKHWHPGLPGALAQAMAEFRPDVVFVEMAQMAQYLRLLRRVPTVLTDHEAGVPANTRTGLGPLGDRRDRRLWHRYLLRCYPLASSLQAVTAEDARALARQFGVDVAVRKPLVPVASAPVDVGRTPPRALFLGDYAHGPNPEAAARLARDLWPRIRAAVPAAELWLAGPNHDRIGELGALPGVRVVGFVPDLAALCAQVRFVFAPIYSGSGVRTKCIAAMAHGLPVVTNTLGARGCDAPAVACRIADDDAALAALAIGLLADPAAAADAGLAAHRWARANVDAAAIARTQIDLASRTLQAFAAREPRAQALPAGTP